MKKILLSLACILSLSFIVSCKMETTTKDSSQELYYGTASGSITVSAKKDFSEGDYDYLTGVFTPAENAKTLSETTIGSIQKIKSFSIYSSESSNSNYKYYYINIYNSLNSWTESLEIYKIDGRYFMDNNDITSCISGDLDDSFTFKYKEEDIDDDYHFDHVDFDGTTVYGYSKYTYITNYDIAFTK